MSKTLVVVDDKSQFPQLKTELLEFADYLAQYPKQSESQTRVINLCKTTQYLSRGYYCSLLAEARRHKVLPSVRTINDIAELTSDNNKLSIPIPKTILKQADVKNNDCLFIYFGWCESERYQKLAKHVYLRFSVPILIVKLQVEGQRLFASPSNIGFEELDHKQQKQFLDRLEQFTGKVWRSASQKRFRWDMAILVNDNEKMPPSDKKALTKFVKAAEKYGINAELVNHEQVTMVSRYDALFLRETTAIQHHTYRLASRAEQEGLVVIDDPMSILRCCNKVFLHDAFTYNQVPTLKTRFVSDCSAATVAEIEQEFTYPIVLKLPESSFSLGVFKVANRTELVKQLTHLFETSSLILIQEYFNTEFDWRIGVLNGRALYACRYYMARNHWQIYNHASKRNSSGGFETLPTFEVPRLVLQAAIKACQFIGNGLYGVDIKQSENKVCVIEVNDNPSIENKVEDLYLGDELYMQIMQEFADRLETRGK